uniref:Uncharacterized protein n=1 Tax=Nothoprocta perdicaria TaxID=30464 RepID=A0A8C7EEF2_NOTPE
MIVATWLAFLLARERSGAPFPTERGQDIPVVEMETVSVLEHWLRKVSAARSERQSRKGSSVPPSPRASRGRSRLVRGRLSRLDLRVGPSVCLSVRPSVHPSIHPILGGEEASGCGGGTWALQQHLQGSQDVLGEN